MARPYDKCVSRERLQEVLDYDAEAGVFRWKIKVPRSKMVIGMQAGSVYTTGYRYIQIDGVPYRACRLAWLHANGEPLPAEVDHRNLNKSDDRIDNLRAADASRNQANRGLMATNTSGATGVRWDAARAKWRASITVNGVAINLGRYATQAAAAAAYKSAARTYFGEFARITQETSWQS